ncbi:hypothetical protein HK096_002131, partial [Nowakowskiella sp. JEL0078]
MDALCEAGSILQQEQNIPNQPPNPPKNQQQNDSKEDKILKANSTKITEKTLTCFNCLVKGHAIND